MLVNDIIKQTMITEVDGVAISTGFRYICKDDALATTIQDLAVAIHADWWSQIAPITSDQVSTTCSIWENLMGNDPTFASFATIAGDIVAGPFFPPDQAIPLTLKSVRTDGKIVTGTLKISGMDPGLMLNGHLIDYDLGLLLEGWLTADRTYGPTVMRSVQLATVFSEKTYPEVMVVQTNPHVVKVPRRRSRLCAVQ